MTSPPSPDDQEDPLALSPNFTASSILQRLGSGGGHPSMRGGDFAAAILKEELQTSTRNPNVLLARWCIEGRAHAALTLAPEGSSIALAAQVLSTSARWPQTHGETMNERIALLLCALVKAGDRKTAGKEFRAMYDLGRRNGKQLTDPWTRRGILAAAHLASTDGDFRACATLCELALNTCPCRETHIAVSRLLAEIADVCGARKELETARRMPMGLNCSEVDVSFQLAEAYVTFSEGNFDEAARMWDVLAKQECAIADDDFFVPSTESSLESFLSACVVSVLVGDVGDVIVAGSRAARHEAANNNAICSLLNGSLDKAINELEDVLKVFGAPHVYDPATAGNLRTLYDLQRRPENERLM